LGHGPAWSIAPSPGMLVQPSCQTASVCPMTFHSKLDHPLHYPHGDSGASRWSHWFPETTGVWTDSLDSESVAWLPEIFRPCSRKKQLFLRGLVRSFDVRHVQDSFGFHTSSALMDQSEHITMFLRSAADFHPERKNASGQGRQSSGGTRMQRGAFSNSSFGESFNSAHLAKARLKPEIRKCRVGSKSPKSQVTPRG
jgi:hypothetical protein